MAPRRIFSPTPRSLTWGNVPNANGDGYSNNVVDTASMLKITTTTGSGLLPANEGLVHRLIRNSTTSNANTNGWPTLASGASKTISNQFGRGAFVAGTQTAGTVAGTWNYLLKLRLVDLPPIFKELDLMANPQINLRFRVNQGVSVITTATGPLISLASTTLQSGSVCPIMVTACYLPIRLRCRS
ncbi:unnamed protein product [Phytophthora lilii]|uniref:Unnamed protein product n=1 Tax=Phytophthora lilii TaxID=2077276 RepID=A0A9W7CTJ3_9STRA|nr:unnamed protein product [Phytophthora lilii]